MSILRFFFRRPVPPEPVLTDFLHQHFSLKPNKVELYRTALNHKSIYGGKIGPNNERLEFLGDAVLDTIVADFLYRKYPAEDEGFLTKMRAKMVSRSTLGMLASKMHIEALVKVNLGSNDTAETIYGNALEALIGAIYLDHGFEKTRERLLIVLHRYLNLDELVYQSSDYKSIVIEWCQKQRVRYNFETTELTSGNGRAGYETRLVINQEVKGYGQGVSKKKAEQEAAKAAYSDLNT